MHSPAGRGTSSLPAGSCCPLRACCPPLALQRSSNNHQLQAEACPPKPTRHSQGTPQGQEGGSSGSNSSDSHNCGRILWPGPGSTLSRGPINLSPSQETTREVRRPAHASRYPTPPAGPAVTAQRGKPSVALKTSWESDSVKITVLVRNLPWKGTGPVGTVRPAVDSTAHLAGHSRVGCPVRGLEL